ncbi:MAG TPA: cytochrome c biogenesis protein CcdA [Thermomicrobiales bacterium]
MTTDVSFIAAFIAGLLSISSPCVLPLLPLYLSHLAGISIDGSAAPSRSRVMANAAAYVVGFSVVFVLLGVAFGAAGALVTTGTVVAEYRYWLVRLGGALLVLLGLHQIGLVRLPFLDRERRMMHAPVSPGSLASSFVVGVSFGAGWSPCVGPILGAILTMAAGQGDPQRAAALLGVYSAGLGIPFLTAALFGTSAAVIRRLTPRLSALTGVSGAIMLAIGAIMILGIYETLFTRLAAMVPWQPLEPNL